MKLAQGGAKKEHNLLKIHPLIAWIFILLMAVVMAALYSAELDENAKHAQLSSINNKPEIQVIDKTAR